MLDTNKRRQPHKRCAVSNNAETHATSIPGSTGDPPSDDEWLDFQEGHHIEEFAEGKSSIRKDQMAFAPSGTTEMEIATPSTPDISALLDIVNSQSWEVSITVVCWEVCK